MRRYIGHDVQQTTKELVSYTIGNEKEGIAEDHLKRMNMNKLSKVLLYIKELEIQNDDSAAEYKSVFYMIHSYMINNMDERLKGKQGVAHPLLLPYINIALGKRKLPSIITRQIAKALPAQVLNAIQLPMVLYKYGDATGRELFTYLTQAKNGRKNPRFRLDSWKEKSRKRHAHVQSSIQNTVCRERIM